MTSPLRFIDTGTSVQLVNHTPSDYLEILPLGIYEVRLSSGMNKYFYLEKYYKDFIVPSKLYGEVEEDVNLILTRYQTKPDSLGALLTGTKGSGKSLVASLLINKFIKELQKPVILVNDSWYENIDELVIFISKFKECLFVFDEFDKHYDKDDQNCLLNFFDDKSKSHRLSLVIANKQREITEYFLGRPSRFFYLFDYENIEKDLLVDYLTDHGLEEMISKFEYLRQNTFDFTFDILQSIVDEIKLRDCKDLAKVLKRFNFDTNAFSYTPSVVVKDIKIVKDSLGYFPPINSLDLSKAILDSYDYEIPYQLDNEIGKVTLTCYGSDLQSYNHETNEYIYKISGYTVEGSETHYCRSSDSLSEIILTVQHLKQQMQFLF